MLNKETLISDKRLIDACFYIPIAIFHKKDGSIAGVRFFLFGNTNNQHNMVNYNLLNDPSAIEVISGFTTDVSIDEIKKHRKTYGVSRGTGDDKGYYYLDGVTDIAHIRSDGTACSDVVQVIPKGASSTDVVSLINWKGFVRRVSWGRASAEMMTNILDGIGNLSKGSLCLRGGTQYHINSARTTLPEYAPVLNISDDKVPVIIKNMPRLSNLQLPPISSGVYINLPWQSQTQAFASLRLPRKIMGKATAFVLCCHTYPNADLLQGGYSDLRLNEINILQAPDLTVLQLMMMEQTNTDAAKRLLKGYYDADVCHCEIYLAPKLRLIELLQGEGLREYTRAASLRLGGMSSLEEVKVNQKVGVLELILDDMYLSLNDTIRVSGTACSVLIIDASHLLKLRTTTLNIDMQCDLIVVRTTPRKSGGEGEQLPFVQLPVGDPERQLRVNYLKGTTKIFVD